MSKYVFSIEGLNLLRHTRALTTMTKLTSIKLNDNTLVFVVASKYKATVEGYLGEYAIKYTVSRLGVFDKISVRRLGYLVGLAVAIIVSILGSLFVYDMSVTGYDAYTVSAILKDNDINYLGYKATIDTHHIRDVLFQNLDISVADVKMVGSILYVNIKQVLPNGEIIDEYTPTPLISEYDCIITRIVSASGTPEVKVGEAVSKGTVLISPYLMVGDTRREVNTIGEVYGKVYFKESISIPRTIVKYVDSDNRYSAQTISIFGKERVSSECKYKVYRREISIKRLYGILPIYKVNITYIEQVPTSIDNPGYDNETDSILATKYSMLEKAKSMGSVLDNWTVTHEVEGYKIIDICIEVEMRVASNIN